MSRCDRMATPAGPRRRAQPRPLRHRASVAPSGVNNVLIVNRVVAAGRIRVIVVRERLGF